MSKEKPDKPKENCEVPPIVTPVIFSNIVLSEGRNNEMSCDCNLDCAGRLKVYAGATSGTIQYMVIGKKLCDLMKCPSFLIRIMSVGTTATNTVSLSTSCLGSVPMVTASTKAAVTVANLPLGSVFEIAIVNNSGVVNAIVLGL